MKLYDIYYVILKFDHVVKTKYADFVFHDKFPYTKHKIICLVYFQGRGNLPEIFLGADIKISIMEFV